SVVHRSGPGLYEKQFFLQPECSLCRTQGTSTELYRQRNGGADRGTQERGCRLCRLPDQCGGILSHWQQEGEGRSQTDGRVQQLNRWPSINSSALKEIKFLCS